MDDNLRGGKSGLDLKNSENNVISNSELNNLIIFNNFKNFVYFT
jgi:hypothetical protein